MIIGRETGIFLGNVTGVLNFKDCWICPQMRKTANCAKFLPSKEWLLNCCPIFGLIEEENYNFIKVVTGLRTKRKLGIQSQVESGKETCPSNSDCWSRERGTSVEGERGIYIPNSRQKFLPLSSSCSLATSLAFPGPNVFKLFPLHLSVTSPFGLWF